ncbi:Fur-regulated basic protein FbpA [Bacillus sp. EB600]|nr:Fur-regulated basic protein FbpA [Bacillus sp. EB600]
MPKNRGVFNIQLRYAVQLKKQNLINKLIKSGIYKKITTIFMN